MDSFCDCPKCGSRAWTRVIEEKEYYYCPYCGARGLLKKDEKPQPIGDPTPDDSNPDVDDEPLKN